jgi:hypothetical protein
MDRDNVEFYSAKMKNKITSFAEKWMEPEIMLSELSRLRNTNIMFPLTYGI